MRRVAIPIAAAACTLGSATVSGQSATGSTTGAIPIEHFTRHDEAGEFKLSPDGRHYSYLTGKRGRSMIGIKSTTDDKVAGGIRVPDDIEVYEYHWISDTRLIYQQAQRYPGQIAATPTGELGAFDLDGNSHRFIYGYRAGQQQTGTLLKVREASYATPELISPFYDDPRSILIAEHPWRQKLNVWLYDPDAKPSIARLNVYTGQKRDLGVVPLRNATVLVDHDDQPRFAVGLDDAFNDSVSWRQTVDGAWTTLALPGFVDETIRPWLITADNQSLMFTAASQSEPLESLYRMNLATKDVTRVFAFERSDIESVVFDFSRKNIIGVTSYVDKPIVHWLNPEDPAARVQRALLAAFANHTVQVVSTSRDGSLAIIFVSSDTAPGEYLLFNTRTMQARALFWAQRQINPRDMRPREPFTLQARDGLTLQGYVTRPAGPGPHPLVVLPHGGPHGVRDYWEYDWEAQLLANRGYAVLQVNFRGSGGFGEKFLEAGFGEWGGRMQDDITDATRWAIDQKIARADRICIFGASYGGYAALQGVVREPDLYRCAIGVSGVYDLELMHSTGDIRQFRSGRAYLERALGSDKERMRSRSPVHNADRIRVPVLLIHGTADWRVDFEQATRMKQALERNRKPFEWMQLSGEGHGIFDEETRRQVYARILAFLDEHLKGATTQQAPG